MIERKEPFQSHRSSHYHHTTCINFISISPTENVEFLYTVGRVKTKISMKQHLLAEVVVKE